MYPIIPYLPRGSGKSSHIGNLSRLLESQKHIVIVLDISDEIASELAQKLSEEHRFKRTHLYLAK